MTDAADKAPRKIQSPRGTRDLYPAEAARRRWLTERWREVSVRHGFEEVDGPTYEEADLYAVKSGEGILGELFQAFSGKSPDEVEQVKQTGRAPYALRPEFTPTLARMYAAKANTLPKPTKWFMAGPFFRAERPQRGRLREFLQWNCDVIGLDIPPEKWNAEDAESRAEVAEAKARMDAEVIATAVAGLAAFGLVPTSQGITIVPGDDPAQRIREIRQSGVQVRINSRETAVEMVKAAGVAAADVQQALVHLDRRDKGDPLKWQSEALALGLDSERFDKLCHHVKEAVFYSSVSYKRMYSPEELKEQFGVDLRSLRGLWNELEKAGIVEWCDFDPSIVRGLAYYTGTVFEVTADGERAVAGGGRYDNLIELFGGPPTPAVGFAMGDVVLSLLLQDKGLMPTDDELMGLVGQRPEVFVLSEDNDEAFKQIRPVVAMLRRGTHASDSPTPAPQVSGLKTQDSGLRTPIHARHSYKATRKPDKLLNEAKKQGAKLAVIIENAERCTVRDLRTGEQWPDPVAIADLHATLLAAL